MPKNKKIKGVKAWVGFVDGKMCKQFDVIAYRTRKDARKYFEDVRSVLITPIY